MMKAMRFLRSSAPVIGLLLVLSPACCKKTIPEPDINGTLQGDGRWELFRQSFDDDGNKLELSVMMRFTAPMNYRLLYFTSVSGDEIPGSRHDEHGPYELTETAPNAGSVSSGTIVFSPVEGDPWTSEYEILSGSGFLVVSPPGIGRVDLDFARYGWG